jgi:uncharacterized protein GlcG (DUF336 family)
LAVSAPEMRLLSTVQEGSLPMAQTLNIPSISNELAETLMRGAVARAAEMQVPMCVAICDPAGTLVQFLRMDHAPLLSVQIAQDKAFTAVSFGMPSHEWHDFIKNDPPLLHGIVHTPRLVVFGGGYPVKVDGKVVGGIGVSGGHYSHDMQVAEAALAAAGLQ